MKKLLNFSLAVFSLCILILFCVPAAKAADATSFDPTKIPITAVASSGFPIGFIGIWPLAQNPPDMYDSSGNPKWLECNGQAINATLYPELAAMYGAAVPNYQGMFLRGVGGNSAALGVQQGDAIRNITGSYGGASFMGLSQDGQIGDARGAFGNGDWKPQFNWMGGGNSYDMNFDASRVVPTASENRPVNKAVRYFVKAKN